MHRIMPASAIILLHHPCRGVQRSGSQHWMRMHPECRAPRSCALRVDFAPIHEREPTSHAMSASAEVILTVLSTGGRTVLQVPTRINLIGEWSSSSTPISASSLRFVSHRRAQSSASPRTCRGRTH